MSVAEPAVRPAGRFVADLAVMVGLGAGLYLLCYPVFFAGMTLSHDDIALHETARLHGPAYWLTTGYGAFFEVGSYQFIRPVSHALMAFNQTVFGDRHDLYMLPFFLLMGLGAAAASGLMRAAGLPGPAAVAAGAGLLLLPSWLPAGLSYVTFQQDALAGALAMLTAYSCFRHRWAWAAAVMTVALFTKEIALFLPFAAALWAIVFARAPRAGLAMLLPLALWLAVRLAAVGSVTGGAYAVSGGVSGLVWNLMRGLAAWPAGLANVGDIKAMLTTAMAGGPLAALAGHPGVAAALGLNLALDAALATLALWLLMRCVRGGFAAAEPADQVLALLTVWTLGAFGLLALLTVGMRFAAALHPALILTLVCVAARWTPVPPGAMWGWARVGAAGLLAVFLAGLAVKSGGALRYHAGVLTEPRDFAALSDAIDALPPAPGGRVLVVNAPITGAAPRWMTSFWGRAETLVLSNRINGCNRAEGLPPPQVEPLVGGRIRVRARVPDCADLLILWRGGRAELARAGAQRTLPGGSTMTYAFPDGRADTSAEAGNTPDVTYGQILELDLAPGDFDYILVRDWTSGAFVPLSAHAAGMDDR